jgi:putative ABC transport system ATP-binding protein
VGPLVECHDVTKTYRTGARETAALRAIDLEIAAGEWVAIMGPSGCGKSTLLHLLGGLDIPDGGDVRIGGEDLTDLTEARRAVLRRRRVGYVFQFFNLLPDLTVAENVELPMLLVGTSRSEAARRRAELLDGFAIRDADGALPAELSGGQQQRVALARALANDPDLLLADEPTGNLDTSAARQVLAHLAARHARGQTIVMVTHDPRVAAAADRILYMEDGRFVPEVPAVAGVGASLLDGPVDAGRT